jgi:hypothetical protein
VRVTTDSNVENILQFSNANNQKRQKQGALTMQPIRQGDVILLPIPADYIAGERVPHLTLAEGERTGHAHRIIDGQAELRERDGILYLTVSSDAATLSHEEHRSIPIPQGTWIIRLQRQYEPGDWRYIED